LSRIDPLVDALKKTEADEVRLVSGERIHLMRQGKRIDIGREPLQQASLLALAGEVLEQKDVAAIMQKEKRSAVVDRGGEKIEVSAQTLAGVLTLTVKRAGKAGTPAPEPQPAYASVPEMQAVKPPRKRIGGHAIDELLEEMMSKQASDLHLTSSSSPALRIHGEMHFLKERPVLTSDNVMQLMQPIFSEKARVDFEEKHDADFAYEVPGLARFRVNVFLDRMGVGAVLRQIPIEIIPAEKLGLPQAVLDLCYLTKGLVVVTGPTGSGKSTTLAGMVDYINKQRQDHIITIEDPVEFVHKNIKCLVNQREVGQHTKSFKNALRAALREDPDIVLVGEMRDLETIAIAIETAETGHLVFGTLHTTTAISTVDRIIDQFPTDQQEQIRVMLSESLKGVIAQVLCKKIGGGRVAAMEILLGNSAVASLIREGKTFQIPSIMQTSRGAGMVTMNDSLLALVQKKLVEPKEAWMKSVDKTGLTMMFKNAGIQFQGAAG
jgi:twitching motility protein PilT